MAHAIRDKENNIRYIILPCDDEDGSEEEIGLLAREDGKPGAVPTHMIRGPQLTEALRNANLIPAE